jgi:hypothetical protein
LENRYHSTISSDQASVQEKQNLVKFPYFQVPFENAFYWLSSSEKSGFEEELGNMKIWPSFAKHKQVELCSPTLATGFSLGDLPESWSQFENMDVMYSEQRCQSVPEKRTSAMGMFATNGTYALVHIFFPV